LASKKASFYNQLRYWREDTTLEFIGTILPTPAAHTNTVLGMLAPRPEDKTILLRDWNNVLGSSIESEDVHMTDLDIDVVIVGTDSFLIKKTILEVQTFKFLRHP